MSSPLRASVARQCAAATPGVTYSATGLPTGLSMSANGVISGATVTGTTTVKATAKDKYGCHRLGHLRVET